MALTKFEKDMNIIAPLDNEPNDVGGLSAEQLKAKFDEGGNTIKTYINETLTAEVDAGLDGKVSKGTTVNGYALSDNVVVTKTDVGLSDCDNTADVNKPVSSKQKAALDLKADKTNVLEKTNTDAFAPTENFHPATKKYVDDETAKAAMGQIPDGSIAQAKLDSALNAKINGAIPTSEKGQPNGVASLDENGIVPISQGGTGASTANSARTNLGAASRLSGTATLAVASWTGSTAPYSYDLSIAGITANDTPHVDRVTGTDAAAAKLINEAWALIAGCDVKPQTSAGKIRFYATEKPTVAIPIMWEVTRG